MQKCAIVAPRRAVMNQLYWATSEAVRCVLAGTAPSLARDKCGTKRSALSRSIPVNRFKTLTATLKGILLSPVNRQRACLEPDSFCTSRLQRRPKKLAYHPHSMDSRCSSWNFGKTLRTFQAQLTYSAVPLPVCQLWEAGKGIEWRLGT